MWLFIYIILILHYTCPSSDRTSMKLRRFACLYRMYATKRYAVNCMLRNRTRTSQITDKEHAHAINCITSPQEKLTRAIRFGGVGDNSGHTMLGMRLAIWTHSPSAIYLTPSAITHGDHCSDVFSRAIGISMISDETRLTSSTM